MRGPILGSSLEEQKFFDTLEKTPILHTTYSVMAEAAEYIRQACDANYPNQETQDALKVVAHAIRIFVMAEHAGRLASHCAIGQYGIGTETKEKLERNGYVALDGKPFEKVEKESFMLRHARATEVAAQMYLNTEMLHYNETAPEALGYGPFQSFRSIGEKYADALRWEAVDLLKNAAGIIRQQEEYELAANRLVKLAKIFDSDIRNDTTAPSPTEMVMLLMANEHECWKNVTRTAEELARTSSDRDLGKPVIREGFNQACGGKLVAILAQPVPGYARSFPAKTQRKLTGGF